MTVGSSGTLTDRATHFQWMLAKSDAPYDNRYTFKGTTTHLLRAGERPVIEVRADINNANFQADCTIAGKTGNPPTD